MHPTITRAAAIAAATGALCGPLTAPAHADGRTPAATTEARQAAAQAGPYLPLYQLRDLAQRWIEKIDLLTITDDESLVGSCAKLTRSSGACTYTSFVTSQYDGSMFECHGRVAVTLNGYGRWTARTSGYRCGP